MIPINLVCQIGSPSTVSMGVKIGSPTSPPNSVSRPPRWVLISSSLLVTDSAAYRHCRHIAVTTRGSFSQLAPEKRWVLGKGSFPYWLFGNFSGAFPVQLRDGIIRTSTWYSFYDFCLGSYKPSTNLGGDRRGGIDELMVFLGCVKPYQHPNIPPTYYILSTYIHYYT